MRKQVGRVLATVAVLGAVVGGCGGPSQAGSAVIVGDDVVPLARVQDQLDAVLGRTELMAQVAAQGGGPADVARDIVTRAVLHDLLEQQAAEAGIVVPDAAVDAEIAERGGVDALLETTFADLPGLRNRVRDELIAAELARRAVGGLTVTADITAATSRAEAEQKAQVLAAGGPEAEAVLADPQTSAQGQVYSAVTNPDAAATVLFGTALGSTVYFQPNPQQSTWIVFRVTERSTTGPSDPAAVEQIGQDQLVAIGERLLQPVASELGVRVNPRYGVWDPIRLRVVPEESAAGAILPPAPAAAAAAAAQG